MRPCWHGWVLIGALGWGATASADPIGEGLTPAEQAAVLAMHNQARALVRSPPLAWSATLADYAQAWAEHLAEEGCELEHRPRQGPWAQRFGENLFLGTSWAYRPMDGVESWLWERELYDGRPIDPNRFRAGHFTQVVWANSLSLGCGLSRCNERIILVCNYDPPGNVIGQKPWP